MRRIGWFPDWFLPQACRGPRNVPATILFLVTSVDTLTSRSEPGSSPAPFPAAAAQRPSAELRAGRPCSSKASCCGCASHSVGRRHAFRAFGRTVHLLPLCQEPQLVERSLHRDLPGTSCRTPGVALGKLMGVESLCASTQHRDAGSSEPEA